MTGKAYRGAVRKIIGLVGVCGRLIRILSLVLVVVAGIDCFGGASARRIGPGGFFLGWGCGGRRLRKPRRRWPGFS